MLLGWLLSCIFSGLVANSPENLAYVSRSPLLFIRGIMTAARYVDDLLQRTLLLYLEDRQMSLLV